MSRLYERLIVTLPRDRKSESVRSALLQAVPVIVDEVADYYWNVSPQEEWNLRDDFPNIAPPWQYAFYEWIVPRHSNSLGKMTPLADFDGAMGGVLVIAHGPDEIIQSPVDDERGRVAILAPILTAALREKLGSYEAAKVAIEQLGGLRVAVDIFCEEKPDVVKRIKHDLIAHRSKLGTPKWVLECLFFAYFAKGRAPAPVSCYQFPVMENGTIIGDPTQPAPIVMWPYLQDAHGADARMEAMKAVGAGPTHPALLAISFSHCKNVEVITHSEKSMPPRLAKRSGASHVVYKTLRIEPMRKVIRDTAEIEGVPVSKALHICRGHFKDYRDRGLFGKLKGIYWWDQNMRGDPSIGRIEKTYEVAAKTHTER